MEDGLWNEILSIAHHMYPDDMYDGLKKLNRVVYVVRIEGKL